MPTLNPAEVKIIFAEDELVFQEIAVPAILKAGIPENNILVADDGLLALEHLQASQVGSGPLIMLLDVRMPNMDGNQCAAKVKELLHRQELMRAPFMVCCSAGIAKDMVSDSTLFHMMISKPFSDSEVAMCLRRAGEWWSDQHGKVVATGQQKPFPQTIKPGAIEMIVADDEMICRMAMMAQLELLGADGPSVHEAEDLEEALEVLRSSQAGDPNRPLLFLLGNHVWLNEISRLDLEQRPPFVVCTSVDKVSDRRYHATLPRQSEQASLRDVVDRCWTWWSSRRQ